jgi:hypothetical protein
LSSTGASSRRRAEEDGRLWVSVFTPVFAFAAAQQIDFILSPWVCATGNHWVLPLVTGLAFLLAVAGGLATWKIWKRLPAPGEAEDPAAERRRFVATGGLLLASVFLTAIVALAIPIFLHRPCD